MSSWYLDLGCSTHMTGKRDWFIKIEDTSEGKINFVDDCSLNEKGVRHVALRDFDGKKIIIDGLICARIKDQSIKSWTTFKERICHGNEGE